MRGRLLVPALCACAAAASSGCADQPLPGTILGTYRVEAHKKSDTCGAGAQAVDPWIFSVELSRAVSTLYWSTLDGRPPMSGPLDPQGAVSLEATVTANVDGTDAGLGPCTMQRTDVIDVTLGAGVPPGSFTASFSYALAPVMGATCDDQLTASGGGYDALPCKLAYDATASRQ